MCSQTSRFEIARLWEQPTELFLQSPGLLPFAVLSQTNNPDNVLRQVARQIERISDHREQSNVAASTTILAGLFLNKDVIKGILSQDIMRESVIYQEIEAAGNEKGVQQGVQQETVSFTSRLLKRGLEKLSLNYKPEFRD